MVRDPNYFLSSLPQTYFMHRDGSLLRVMVDTPDNLRHLRTELELLKRVARKSVSWNGAVDATVADKYQESDRTELDRILFDAWHPMIDEMIVLFDQEFEDVKEEILLSVVDEEAANIVQEAAECGVLKPVEDLVATNKMKNPYGSSLPSDIEDALAAAEKAIANAAQMNSQQITEDEGIQDSEILDSFNLDLEKTDSVLETATHEAATELDLSDEQDKPDHTLQFMEQIQELKAADVDVEDDQAKNEAKDFDLHSSVPQDFSLPEMENHGSQDETTETISSEESSDHAVENIENSDDMTPDDHESIDPIPDIRTINPFAAAFKPKVMDSEVKADSDANADEQQSFISNVLGESQEDQPDPLTQKDILSPNDQADEPQQVSFELPEPEAMISAALEPTQDEKTSNLMNFEIGDPLAAIESLQDKMEQITNDAEVDPLATSADQAPEDQDASSEKMLPPASSQDITDQPEDTEKFTLSDPQVMMKDTNPEFDEGKNAVVPTPEELADMQHIESDLEGVDETQLDTTPAAELDVEGIMAAAEDHNADEMNVDDINKQSSNDESQHVPVSQSSISTSDEQFSEEQHSIVPTPEELSNMQNIESALEGVDETQLDTTPAVELDVEGIMAAAEDQNADEMNADEIDKQPSKSESQHLPVSQSSISTSDEQFSEEQHSVVPTPEELSNMQNIESALEGVDETQLDTTPAAELDVEAIMALADEKLGQDLAAEWADPELELTVPTDSPTNSEHDVSSTSDSSRLNEEDRVTPPTPQEVANLENSLSEQAAFQDFDESQLDTTPVSLSYVDEIVACADEQSDPDATDPASSLDLESGAQPIVQNESTEQETHDSSDPSQLADQQDALAQENPPSTTEEPEQPHNPFVTHVPVNTDQDEGQSSAAPTDVDVLPEPILPEAVSPVELHPDAEHEEHVTPSTQQLDTDQPVENVTENDAPDSVEDRSIEYTPERAQLAVVEIEKGIRKISNILNTEVNDQWKTAQQLLQQIVESHTQVCQTQQNINAVMAEMAQVRSQILSVRDETQQACVEILQLRNEAHRANEEARTSAEAAKLAAEQANLELQNIRKTAGH